MVDVCSRYSVCSDWLLERRDFSVTLHGHNEVNVYGPTKKGRTQKMITGNCYGVNESELADLKNKMSDNKRSESDLLYSTLICNMHGLDRFMTAALDSTNNVNN